MLNLTRTAAKAAMPWQLADVVVTLPDGREVVFRVIESRGSRVRVGVEAPADCQIYRREVMPARPAAPGG